MICTFFILLYFETGYLSIHLVSENPKKEMIEFVRTDFVVGISFKIFILNMS